jgi:hypothetical protein
MTTETIRAAIKAQWARARRAEREAAEADRRCAEIEEEAVRAGFSVEEIVRPLMV